MTGLWAESPPTDTSEALQMIGTLKTKKVSESSGLALSHYLDDAFWTMNDSGHPSDVFLFGDHGQTLAHCELKDAKNRDWEAMSSFQRGGKGYLLVADVGDNLARRDRCELYTFEEPVFKPRKKKSFSKKLKARKIEFRYQDGPRNCEAVACEPDGSAVYLIEKIFLETTNRKHPGIYKLSLPPAENHVDPVNESLQVAQRVGDFPVRGVTGMAISPDGKRLAIRNYLSAHLLEREPIDGKLPPWEVTFKHAKPKIVPMPLQVQGEAISFTRDNNHLIVTSETVRQAIWKVRVPSTKK